MVQVSDGKSRPRPARLVLTMEAVTVQLEMPVPVQPPKDKTVPHARVCSLVNIFGVLHAVVEIKGFNLHALLTPPATDNLKLISLDQTIVCLHNVPQY